MKFKPEDFEELLEQDADHHEDAARLANKRLAEMLEEECPKCGCTETIEKLACYICKQCRYVVRYK